MKKLLALTALMILLNITGCYTVIWSPGEDFPSGSNNRSGNNSQTGGDEGYYYDERTGERYYGSDYYYDPIYYGSYSSFYSRPWWYSVNPNEVYNEINKENRSKDGSAVRNNDGGGRNREDRRGDILNTTSPTKTGSSSGSTNKTSGGSGSGDSTNSRNSSNGNNKKSDTNSTRNDDGGRNTDRGKR